jgi:putative nucleotidyltransferase with HDIG domain
MEPKKMNNILKNFHNAGVAAVIVGGTVRDKLLGRKSKDLDLASPLSVEELKTKVVNQDWCNQVIDTGIAHGTVTIEYWDNLEDGPSQMIEVTQFRRDVECDGRHATVEATSFIEEDLARRDLTINAMAMNINESIIDPFKGREDLSNKLLRTVGDANKRFTEDYLRIIRIYRFQACLPGNWQIECDASISALRLANNVWEQISVERIIAEFNKVFNTRDANVYKFLSSMWDLGILGNMLPELNQGPLSPDKLIQNPTYHPEGSVLEHIFLAVQHAPTNRNCMLNRWMALLHDVGKPKSAAPSEKGDWFTFYGHETIGVDMMKQIGDRLKFPTELRKIAETLTRWHLYVHRTPATAKNVRKLQADVKREYLPLLEDLYTSDHMGRCTSEDAKVFFMPLPIPVKPVLMGKHLIARGHIPGPTFKPILDKAFEYQIETGELEIDNLYKKGVNKC